jgi:hypothetical protein
VRWLEARQRELLPTRYVHVVFTLPRELAPLALQNKRLIYNLHRDVMRAVPHINPRGVRMNHLQAWVLRLQSSRPFLSLLPVSPQLLACRHQSSPRWKIRIRFGPVTIG